MSAAIKDNKKTEADNDEVAKKLLEIKTQSMETRKTPVSQDIGTLFYDCEYAYGLEIQDKDLKMVFCYQNCSDLLWEKLLQILGLQPRISKVFLNH